MNNNRTEYLVKEIKGCLTQLNKLADSYSFLTIGHFDYDDDLNIEEEINLTRSKFYKYLYQFYNLTILFLEINNLTFFLEHFKNELMPYLSKSIDPLDFEYVEEIDEGLNIFLPKLTLMLSVFQELNNSDYINDIFNKDISFKFLKNLLKGTAVIMKEKNINNETTINRHMRSIIQSIFPDSQFPKEPFNKTAKQYKPDILIPSIKCAIEYKYAKDENRLINVIDEILIDVNGYNNHKNYKYFIAVFYVSPCIWDENRFKVVWEEKKFPKNWESIFVLGK